METKELKIEVPSGYIIDVENSTFDKIIFKKKELTYEDVCDKLFKGTAFVIETGGKIINTIVGKSRKQDSNNLTSKSQAEKILALIKLMNVATYLNDGWKPDWSNEDEYKYYIYYNNRTGEFYIEDNSFCQSNNIYFKTEELAKQAIKILGEDVIRTALSTDY